MNRLFESEVDILKTDKAKKQKVDTFLKAHLKTMPTTKENDYHYCSMAQPRVSLMEE